MQCTPPVRPPPTLPGTPDFPFSPATINTFVDNTLQQSSAHPVPVLVPNPLPTPVGKVNEKKISVKKVSSIVPVTPSVPLVAHASRSPTSPDVDALMKHLTTAQDNLNELRKKDDLIKEATGTKVVSALLTARAKVRMNNQPFFHMCS
jgi:hypothetical protein